MAAGLRAIEKPTGVLAGRRGRARAALGPPRTLLRPSSQRPAFRKRARPPAPPPSNEPAPPPDSIPGVCAQGAGQEGSPARSPATYSLTYSLTLTPPLPITAFSHRGRRFRCLRAPARRPGRRRHLLRPAHAHHQGQAGRAQRHAPRRPAPGCADGQARAPGINPADIGDIVIGSVLGDSSQRAIQCRIASLLAGIPDTVPIAHRQPPVLVRAAGHRVCRGRHKGWLLHHRPGGRRGIHVHQPHGLGGRHQPPHRGERARAELPAADG